MDFDQQVYGGLQTTDPALIALQRSVLAPQAYAADVDDTNVSGSITAAYKVDQRVNAYATYATSFKSVGLNLAACRPTRWAGRCSSAATVRPEDERHVEVGVKTEPFRGVTANFTAFNTDDQGLPGAGRQRRASACCAAISRTPRRCASAASSSTAARG